MMTHDGPLYQSIVERAQLAVAAIWEDFQNSKEALTIDHPTFLQYSALEDPVSFYFEFESTTITVAYAKQPQVALQVLRDIKTWENIIPALTVKMISAAETFFGKEALNKFETPWELKTTFTNANTDFFPENPFDKVILATALTITDLTEEDAVELLTIIQYMTCVVHEELYAMVRATHADMDVDFIFGEA